MHNPTPTQQEIPAAVLRIASAGPYLSVSRSHLYNLIERKELPLIKLGGRASGILRADLDAWLAKQRAAALS
ncbi:helix-turn-helix transcriptional regulator [Paucibacter sp. TC2R-5]|uniref:helix-turn-helix transcriptional regulator n=1 Tax=Paucibacter sp. TC2R-5 TaxID=2893555 RepID=UPI0039DFAC34